jgi:hypothetical protein
MTNQKDHIKRLKDRARLRRKSNRKSWFEKLMDKILRLRKQDKDIYPLY